ncbi:hypothetical protein [Anaerofustis sp. NSJ-163]|uniref:hypothetical protein n=1 Tax=Anaerofustis sp. NSJ-163 TaxID=2944391 RepID=UPI00209BFDA4|nr:hypothetical protein [Anaerofustis sp. NSJ-163]MCO8194390.1 hypothetical protein [Anaerofustis sp. NSJ-163]
MELITGYQLEDHVTSLQDAMWHRGIWKDDCIISVGENLKAEIISNNEIRVRSGILNMQGKFCSIDMNTYDSLTINNGTAGENRIDLIVARYEKNSETQVEDVSLKVIQGTPVADTPSVPSYTEGNIDNGDLIAELPLYEVHIEGINITKVEKCLDIVYPLSEVRRTLLFGGAVKTGVITLNESMNNYRYLVFNISSSTSGGPFGSGIYPILEQNQMSTQSVLCYDSVPKATYNANAVTIYTGRFTKQSDTQLNTDIPIHNNIIRTEQSIGGGTEYYVREIWGVR